MKGLCLSLLLVLGLSVSTGLRAGSCANPAEAGPETAPILEVTDTIDTWIETSVEDYNFPPNTAGFKDISYTVPSTGLYTIEGRVWASSDSNNSWYMEIVGFPDVDGHGVEIYDINTYNSSWVIEAVNKRLGFPAQSGPVREWFLPAGVVTLRFYGRETGTRLDCFGFVDQPTYTPTHSPTATSTASATATPTHSPTASSTSSFTHSPTATYSPTPSASPTATASFTATASSTPTATISATATSSVTVSSTFTPPASSTTTPTRTRTPGQLLTLRVFDQDNQLVRDLGSVWVHHPQTSLSVQSESFSPEQQGLLNIQAGPRGSWVWAGDRQDGKGAANGRYTLRLSQAGLVDIETSLWLVRGDIDLGSGGVFPNPVRQAPVWIQVAAGATVSVEVRIYNSAGERVSQMHLPPGLPRMAWDLRSSSGEALASGIYLVQLHYHGSAGQREVETFKMAVLK